MLLFLFYGLRKNRMNGWLPLARMNSFGIRDGCPVKYENQKHLTEVKIRGRKLFRPRS